MPLSCSHRMLEYGEYKGHLYGTSVNAVRAVLAEGKICVMDLEPQVGLCRTFSITLKSQMHVICVVRMPQTVTEMFCSDRLLKSKAKSRISGPGCSLECKLATSCFWLERKSYFSHPEPGPGWTAIKKPAPVFLALTVDTNLSREPLVEEDIALSKR